MHPTVVALEALARQMRALESLDGLAGWDAETYLPANASDLRGAQSAAVRAVIHEKLTGSALGALLEEAAALKLEGRAASLVKVLARDRARERNVPSRLVEELAVAQAKAGAAWRNARANNDFPLFAPHLETLLALRKEQADARGHSGERYDAMLESNEPGMTVARLEPVLARLRDGLGDILKSVAGKPAPDDAFLTADAWDVDAQYGVALELLKGIGFNLESGRLDRSVHPFCQGMGPSDVRLTTRLFRNDGANGLFSALHEGGHGLYEQGLPDDGLPISTAASMGLHESQSRLWENVVGRSRPFWSHWLPRLEKVFPQALAGVSLDRWLASINRVRPSLIRVDADEVTYNLHILVRFELELSLVRGKLAVKDLPDAWNAAYQTFLGITPPNNTKGVLQDIHWSFGEFGYFPTYAIGNMYAASLAKAAERSLGTLWEDIGQGRTAALLGWLRTNVHQVGRTKDAETTVKDATGNGLTEVDLLAYLRAKMA